MLSVFRPSFKVVKEGRILHFVSGYRRFSINDRKIQEVAGSSLTSYNEDQTLTRPIADVILFGASSDPNWRCHFVQAADRKCRHLVPGFALNWNISY